MPYVKILSENQIGVTEDVTKFLSLLPTKAKSQTAQSITSSFIRIKENAVEFGFCDPYSITGMKVALLAENSNHISTDMFVPIPTNAVSLLKDISTPYSIILEKANVTAFNSNEKYEIRTLDSECNTFTTLKEQLRQNNPEPRATAVLDMEKARALYEKLKFVESAAPSINESYYYTPAAIILKHSNEKTVLAATDKYVLAYTPVDSMFTVKNETALFLLPLNFKNIIGQLIHLPLTSIEILLFSNHIEINAIITDNDNTTGIYYLLPLVNGTIPDIDNIINKEMLNQIVITDSELPAKLRKIARACNKVRMVYNDKLQLLIVSTMKEINDSGVNVSIGVKCEPPTTPLKTAIPIDKVKAVVNTLLLDGGNRFTIKFNDILRFESPNYIFMVAPVVSIDTPDSDEVET